MKYTKEQLEKGIPFNNTPLDDIWIIRVNGKPIASNGNKAFWSSGAARRSFHSQFSWHDFCRKIGMTNDEINREYLQLGYKGISKEITNIIKQMEAEGLVSFEKITIE